MVLEITNKVKNQPRSIEVQVKQNKGCEQLLVVSTYDQPLFKFVKMVGPNLKSQTTSINTQALGTKKGSKRNRGCKMCSMICPYVMTGNKKGQKGEINERIL